MHCKTAVAIVIVRTGELGLILASFLKYDKQITANKHEKSNDFTVFNHMKLLMPTQICEKYLISRVLLNELHCYFIPHHILSI